jgi:hypothetical protein
MQTKSKKSEIVFSLLFLDYKKVVHYGLLFALPWILHGPTAALVGAASYYATQVGTAGSFFKGWFVLSTMKRHRDALHCMYACMYCMPESPHVPANLTPPQTSCFEPQGLVLASTFAVSHNIPESKPLDDGERAG